MEMILKAEERPAANVFWNFIETLTPKQQEKMDIFIQGIKLGRRIEQQLQATGS